MREGGEGGEGRREGGEGGRERWKQVREGRKDGEALKCAHMSINPPSSHTAMGVA